VLDVDAEPQVGLDGLVDLAVAYFLVSARLSAGP